MELSLLRYLKAKGCTFGKLYIGTVFECYTIEDEERPVKVYGQTCIPAGRYEVKLRPAGGFHERYAKKFGAMHKGMLHITGVKGFEWILIHIGNTPEDTKGCVLVGRKPFTDKAFLSGSEEAYKALYPKIAAALQRGERVSLNID